MPRPIEVLPSVALESAGTPVLGWVILNVAFAKGTENKEFYGAAMGLILVKCL